MCGAVRTIFCRDFSYRDSETMNVKEYGGLFALR